jgi:hypothetical protein
MDDQPARISPGGKESQTMISRYINVFIPASIQLIQLETFEMLHFQGMPQRAHPLFDFDALSPL